MFSSFKTESDYKNKYKKCVHDNFTPDIFHREHLEPTLLYLIFNVTFVSNTFCIIATIYFSRNNYLCTQGRVIRRQSDRSMGQRTRTPL
jgi:hypothetical protein